MRITKHEKNVHSIEVETDNFRIAMLSDIHWDNPKCNRDLLRQHLDFCVQENIPIFINGDFFCLMQGRGDNRRNKSDIRPEHNNARYLDSIVETAAEWWAPYASHIVLIGYGNHETGVIKWQETDLLQRFVDLLNFKCGTMVQVGGYGGWLIVRMKQNTAHVSFKIKYFHGSGGGGIVTKGAINLTRAMELYDGYDVFTMGHIHENWARNDIRDTITHSSKVGYAVQHKHIHSMITGTYKEEYETGDHGWHVERGAPPKILGGRILTLSSSRYLSDNQRYSLKKIESIMFPI
jgi:hypothetical protein